MNLDKVISSARELAKLSPSEWEVFRGSMATAEVERDRTTRFMFNIAFTFACLVVYPLFHDILFEMATSFLFTSCVVTCYSLEKFNKEIIV